MWEGKNIGKHLKKIMKLSIELIGDNDKDNVMIIKITNNEKDRGGRGEDVGGRLDIGEQLIPLLLLCSSYDWAAWPFLNPQCRFYSPHIKLQLTLTLHNIECN